MSTTFAADLAAYGPQRCANAASAAEGTAYCRRLAETHYENFHVASRLLPRALRPHFYAVYAYCRWADDLADEVDDAGQSLELLDWWEQQLRECYAGRATHPVFVALRPTITEFSIPIEPFADLLVAFRQDRSVTRYETVADVLGYCRYSANPVGRLVLHLARVHDPAMHALSDSVCTGLQLANFCQDVASDWGRGRVYLPQETLRQCGYTEDDFARGAADERFRKVMKIEVDRAEKLLRNGLPLVDRMPRGLRGDMGLFIHGGLAILDRIREVNYDVWNARPSLSKFEKAKLLAGAMWRNAIGPRRTTSPEQLSNLVNKKLQSASPPSAEVTASYAECQALARRAAGNFYYSFLVLPKAKRRAMCALYAFLRHTDDLGDSDRPVAERRAALAAWRQSLDNALAGKFDSSLLPALADTVSQFGIPRQYLHEVLDGVEMDLDERVYETFGELADYCYKVASAVGLCCIHIWGFRGAAALDIATPLGIAFQLTNILRDLKEDAESGRVYLPQEDLRRFQYGADELARGVHDHRFSALMRFEIARAEDHYRRGDGLERFLERDSRPALRAMVGIYRGLLDEIKRRDGDVFTSRVRLSGWRKARIAIASLLARTGFAAGTNAE
jgi:squalene synthase HpnC/squalene synthase HpnD